MTKESENLVREILDRMENEPQFWELFLWQARAFTDVMLWQGFDVGSMPDGNFNILLVNKITFCPLVWGVKS